jgi:hypothetical protein
VGLERGPLSLVNTNEKLLERKSNGSGLEKREYGSRDPLTTWHPLSAKFGTDFAGKRRSVGRSVGIVRSRTQATEFIGSKKCYMRSHLHVVSTSLLRANCFR